MKQILFPGVYKEHNNIITLDLRTKNPRVWDPKHSKLAAGIKKGLSQLSIKEHSVVLYLGASSGTTVSHVSDIIGKRGFVFAIDLAPRVMRELVYIAEKRKNIAPILADANHPSIYEDKISKVDVVFQDISQRNQVEIFKKNCECFLKENCFAILCVKANSIDSSKKPKDIYQNVRKQLERSFKVVDFRDLHPIEKNHYLFVIKK